MWLLPSRFQCLAAAGVAAGLLAAAPVGAQEAGTQDKPAQSAPAPKPPKPYGGGSPLDVILHTKFWETPPPVKPWVKATREPQSSLHYQSTATVADPKRPKPLSSDQLNALRSELEQADAHNHQAAAAPDPNATPESAPPQPKVTSNLKRKIKRVAKAALRAKRKAE